MGDQQVAVGKLDWVQQQARLDSNSQAESLGASLQGQSVVYVGVQGRGVVGALGFAGDQMLRVDVGALGPLQVLQNAQEKATSTRSIWCTRRSILKHL